MVRNALLILLAGFVPTWSIAADEVTADVPEVLAPFLNEQTLSVTAIDIAHMDASDWFKRLKPLIPLEKHKRIAEITASLGQSIGELPAGGVNTIYVVTSLSSTSDSANSLIRPSAVLRSLFYSTFVVIPGTQPEAADKLQATLKRYSQILEFKTLNGATAVTASGTDLLAQLAKLQPKARPEFGAALSTVKDRPIRICLAPPPVLSKAVEELFPQLLPPSKTPLGQILSHGLRWLAIGMVPDPEHAQIQFVVQSSDRNSANEMLGLLQHLQTDAQVATQVQSMFEKWIPASVTPLAKLPLPDLRAENDRVIWDFNESACAEIGDSIKTWLVALHRATEHENHLKEIGLAILNYESSMKTFPARSNFDAQGKPLLSWRVLILPFLGTPEATALYKQFKLDEPWDSPHNKKLIPQVPADYRAPSSEAPEGQANYVVVTGEGLLFDGGPGKPMQALRDGTSKTILALGVDDEHAPIWTKPDDLEWNPQQATKGVGLFPSDRPAQDPIGRRAFLVVFADGHTAWLPETIEPDLFKALLTPAGGESVQIPAP